MQIVQRPVVLGVRWPGGDEVKFSKAELATLAKAADILSDLRTRWSEDEEAEGNRTDVVLAMYALQELVEDGGFEL